MMHTTILGGSSSSLASCGGSPDIEVGLSLVVVGVGTVEESTAASCGRIIELTSSMIQNSNLDFALVKMCRAITCRIYVGERIMKVGSYSGSKTCKDLWSGILHVYARLSNQLTVVDLLIDGSRYNARFINHSCRPSCEFPNLVWEYKITANGICILDLQKDAVFAVSYMDKSWNINCMMCGMCDGDFGIDVRNELDCMMALRNYTFLFHLYILHMLVDCRWTSLCCYKKIWILPEVESREMYSMSSLKLFRHLNDIVVRIVVATRNHR